MDAIFPASGATATLRDIAASVDAMAPEDLLAAAVRVLRKPVAWPALGHLYGTLQRAGAERAIAALHEELRRGIVGRRLQATDLLRAIAAHCSDRCICDISTQVVGPAADTLQGPLPMDAAHLERLLRDALFSSSSGERLCALVLMDRLADGEFAGGCIVVHNLASNAGTPGSLTGRWIDRFISIRSKCQEPGPGGEFLLIEFPAQSHGGDNDCSPMDPAAWIGETYCDGKDPDEHDEDDDVEVFVFVTLAGVCEHLRHATIELVVDQRATVLYRSNDVVDTDLSECVITAPQ